MSGTIPAKGVYVISNSNADLNLQSLANHLTADLDFENNLILDLKHNSTILDRIGQTGTPTSGGIDFVQLLQDPYAYLATFHLDLNDYQNIDIRRGMVVTAGNPKFNSATDIIGKWGYFLNFDRSDIGQHLGLCNKPAGTDIFGYNKPSQTLYSTNINSTDPIEIVVNGQLNGFASSSGLLQHNQFSVGQNDAIICNNGSIPYADMNWVGGTNGACFTNNFTYQTSNNPKAKVTADADLNILAFGQLPPCKLRLVSNSFSDVLIDFANYNHVITIQRYPTAVNDVYKDAEVSIYPNYTYSDLTINSKNINKYTICDMLGKTILTGVISSNTNTISTSSLPQGMYLILFTSNKGKAYSQKFAKL